MKVTDQTLYDEEDNIVYSTNSGMSGSQVQVMLQQIESQPTTPTFETPENNPSFDTPSDEDNIIIANAPSVNGLGGNDTLVYAETPQGAHIVLSANWAYNDGNGGQSYIQNIENVSGSDFNDILVGDENINVLNGEGGNDTIYGHYGDDTLTGGLGRDTIYGDLQAANALDGTDTIHGGAGDDLLSGGGGEDLINGDEDNDLIYGQSGADTLNGGTGNDTIYGDFQTDTGNDGADIIDGGAGNDILAGGGGNDTIAGGQGVDQIFGGGGTDIADYRNDIAGVTVNLSSYFGIDGWGTRDSLVSIESIHGSAFNDILVGDAAINTIWGNEGADTIYGLAGNDILNGGAGNDLIYGDTQTANASDGNDTIDGGAGNDILAAGGGNDTVNGGTENDTIYGGAGVDQLFGGDGDDIIYGDFTSETGNDGIDTIDGGGGNDILYGGGGNDTFIGSIGSDQIFGGSGVDTINYSANTLGIYASLEGGFIQNYLSGAGAFFHTVTGVENLVGANVRDYMVGNSSANTLYGMGGNDTLSGSGGDDIVYGGDGNDWLIGDFIQGGGGLDGNDTLLGEGGDDFLIGMGGVDQLYGGAGNDTLFYDRDDVFYGGDDFDTIRMVSNDASDWNLNWISGSGIEHIALDNFNGFAAANTFNFRHWQIDNITDTMTIYVTGDSGLDTVVNTALNASHLVGAITFNGVLMDHYERNGYTMYIQQGLLEGSEESNGIIGDDTGETLTGTSEADTILANGGNDIIDGLGGADIINAGTGADTIIFDQADTVNGGENYDTLLLNNGDTTSIDLSSSFTGIDEIDMRNGAANTIAFHVNQIDEIADSNFIFIFGDYGSDVATITGLATGEFQGYIAYENEVFVHYLDNNTANSLYIQHGIIDLGESGDGFVGTSGNDTFSGTAAGDVFLTYDGDDTINYTAGDVFGAGAGYDTVTVANGNTDTIEWQDLYSIEEIDLTNGAANSMVFSMSQGLVMAGGTSLIIQGDIGIDNISINQLNHNNHLIDISEVDGQVIAHYQNQGLDLYIEWGLGTFTNAPTGQGFVGDGTAETINGTSQADAIYAYGGNDTINAGAGADLVYAGDGDDILYYDDANDMLYGGAGTDTLALNAGDPIGLNSGRLRYDVDSIEVLDLTNGVNNTAIIRMSHILDFGENDLLYVLGDAGDVVDARQLNTTNHFVGTVEFNGTTFDHYNNAGADLFVEQGLMII